MKHEHDDAKLRPALYDAFARDDDQLVDAIDADRIWHTIAQQLTAVTRDEPDADLIWTHGAPTAVPHPQQRKGYHMETPLQAQPVVTFPQRRPAGWRGISAIAVLVIVVLFGVLFWRSHTSTPSADPAAEATISQIQMLSADEGWAVGTIYHHTTTSEMIDDHALFLHYQRQHWQQVTVPFSLKNVQLESVSMVSPTEGWAAGMTYMPASNKNFATTFHYVSGQWHVQAVLSNGNGARIAMGSATDGWLSVSSDQGGELYHYMNGQWIMQPNTGVGQISMISATEGWATPSLDDPSLQGTPLLHYINGSWHHVNQPSTEVRMGIIQMLSATNGWAGVSLPPYRNHLYHFDGTNWTSVPLDLSFATDTGSETNITSLAFISATDGWLTLNGNLASMLLRYHDGTWTRELKVTVEHQEGTIHDSFALSSTSATDAWTTGFDAKSTPGEVVFQHYQQGQWSAVMVPIS